MVEEVCAYVQGESLKAQAARARVHISIVAGRWQRDHQNYKRFSRLIDRDTLKDRLMTER
jgi:phenolic acid decarboxylase